MKTVKTMRAVTRKGVYKQQWEKGSHTYSVNIRCADGHVFCIETFIPQDMAEYLNEQAVNIERVHDTAFSEVLHTIPTWAVDLGLIDIWCFVQDVFWLRNPWRK